MEAKLKHLEFIQGAISRMATNSFLFKLEAELRGNRDGYLANLKVGCHELRELVNAVKDERKAQRKSTSGRVPVSDEAAEKAARKNLKTAWLADSGQIREKNHADGSRTIDLDYSEEILGKCPK